MQESKEESKENTVIQLTFHLDEGSISSIHLDHSTNLLANPLDVLQQYLSFLSSLPDVQHTKFPPMVILQLELKDSRWYPSSNLDNPDMLGFLLFTFLRGICNNRYDVLEITPDTHTNTPINTNVN